MSCLLEKRLVGILYTDRNYGSGKIKLFGFDKKIHKESLLTRQYGERRKYLYFTREKFESFILSQVCLIPRLRIEHE
jgi:hypothetical protein